MTTYALILVGVFACIGVLASPVPPSHYPPTVASLMNFSADPCNDFYNYACGAWIQRTVLPPTDPIFDRAITSIEDHNSQVLQRILESPQTKYPKINAFYNECMNTTQINSLGVSPTTSIWQFLGVKGDLGQFMQNVAMIHQMGLPSLFAFSVVTDPEDPTNNIIELDQGGYNLPSRDMYNDTQPGVAQLLANYTQHIDNMFKLYEGQSVANVGSSVVTFEAAIAAINLPIDDIRDPLSVYHKMDIGELTTLCPNIPFDKYFSALGVNNLTAINIAEPAYFKALDELLSSTDASTLSFYNKWSYLHNIASLLPDSFVQETFDFFGKEIDGQTAPTPRSASCVAATDAALGQILGQAFVDASFSGKSLQVTTTMVMEIEQAFGNTLKQLPWMDPKTKAAALLKLSEVTRRVGYPKNPSTYPGYQVTLGQFYKSTISKQYYDFMKTLATIGQPPNKNQWLMTADTVNAYYQPTDNSINFPAGIMQYPYFAANRTLAENYGGVGVIMGHELTHGFDDQGRMYDGHGKLQNWWQPSTLQHFDNETHCMVDQYSQFQVLPGVHVNGNQTLGENIADNGGVLNAYHAYYNHVKGLVDNPLFFVAYAQGWCAKATPAYERVRVQTDVHSPPKFRVIGPLMNFDEFSSTFSCPLGSVMNPQTKCKVW